MKVPLNSIHKSLSTSPFNYEKEDPIDLDIALSSKEPDVMAALEESLLRVPSKN